jgi:hypothetical protein
MKSNDKKNENSCLKKRKDPLYILILLTFCVTQCSSAVDLTKVPLLDNKSSAEVDYLLENASLIANKSYCFSDSTPRHFAIPKTQDPVQDTIWYKGGEVKVKISEGKFPSVIGMSQPDAEQTIASLNLTPIVVTDRNETVPQGFVFDQEPKNVGCHAPSIVKIFINAPLSVYNITLYPINVLGRNIEIEKERAFVDGD